MNINNLYKLFTHEDQLHIHKIAGMTCLINFIYRFVLLLINKTMDLNNYHAMYLIIIHGFLSVSSLIFRISNNRIKSGPMIYPEFRLHSICFAMRSIICYLIMYNNLTYNLELRIGVCFLTMIFADIITYYYKKETTMRAMPFDKNIQETDKKNITYFNSSQQIYATLFMLGSLETIFCPLFAIQIAAFLMTLVRKSIITTNLWHILYSLSLMINIFAICTITPSNLLIFSLCAKTFMFLRCKNVSKYILWTIMFGIYYMSNNMLSSVDIIIKSLGLTNLIIDITIGVYILLVIHKIYPLFFVQSITNTKIA